MACNNLFAQFKELFPDPVLQIGEVIQYADGEATVQVPGGGLFKARGIASVGDNVFVRNGLIEGAAPALSVVTVEI